MSLSAENESTSAPAARQNSAGAKRLWKLLGWVALGHVVVILALSPGLYWSNSNSPEDLFARGEAAMKEGKYAEAMELFRKVMDQQPKPPPIYSKAAEFHRLADRLGRQNAGKESESAERAKATAADAAPATQPVSLTPVVPKEMPNTRAPTTQTVEPYIPPELRGRVGAP